MKRFYYLILTFLVVVSFWLIGCQNETVQSGNEKIVYVDRTIDISQGGQDTKITSLQLAINTAKPNDVIDFTDPKYSTITTIEPSIAINKAVTIKNFDNLGGSSLNVISDGVVLSNVGNTNVYTNSSLKISGSSLSSLNIGAVDLGRGEFVKPRPPRVELLSSDVSSDVVIALDNAELTVHDVTADKIKFNADNTQLTVEDSSSVINRFETDKDCQVVLEDGTSDTIPCVLEKMDIGSYGKLTQINMQAAESLILTKLSPESGLVTTMTEDESIDFSNLEVIGTYMATGAVTVFTAKLTYDLQSTFTKKEKDFKIKIGNDLAFQRVDGNAVQTNFDWSSLSAGYHSAVIESDFADKGLQYAYSFDITVIDKDVDYNLVDLTVDISSIKKEYLSDETLDLTGLVVTGTYHANAVVANAQNIVRPLNVSEYRVSPANGSDLTTDSGEKMITITVSDLTDDISVDFELKVYPSCLYTLDYGYKLNGVYRSITKRIKQGYIENAVTDIRNGYTFNYWYKGDNPNDEYQGFNSPVMEDTILHAKWTKTLPFVGAIVYEDVTTSDETNDGYIFMADPITNDIEAVPLGVVFNVDSTNDIGRMVHLKQAEPQYQDELPLEWCKYGTDTSLLGSIDTDDDDGSINWQNIMNVISDNIGNYPAFEYVNGLNSDQATIDAKYQWYLPAKNELIHLLSEFDEVKAGLQKLKDAEYSCVYFDEKKGPSNAYWSSSLDDLQAYMVYRTAENTVDNQANALSIDFNVRAIRKFNYKIGQ